MELLIYKTTSDFYHFFYTDDSLMTMLKNIDSLKNGILDSLSDSIYQKIFHLLIKYKDCEEFTRLNDLKLPELKGTVFDLICAVNHLFEIHPIVSNLIIFYYMTKYKCCDREDIKIFFELSLRDYMGFFLEPKIINIIFEWECIHLYTFILNGLYVLNEAAAVTRKYLIHDFYRYYYGNKYLLKECSETQSVFNLTDYKNKSVVNICAGNACGIHLLESKMTCINLVKYNGMKLLEIMDICHFVECDIMDNIFKSISSLFNLWVAIHACGTLSTRIIEEFLKHAHESSELYLVPCCIFRRNEYKNLLDNCIFDRIYKNYCVSRPKNDVMRQYCNAAMHIELLSSLCIMHKFKIKTLSDMRSVKNKVIIVYK